MDICLEINPNIIQGLNKNKNSIGRLIKIFVK